jgi:hypothetical protein
VGGGGVEELEKGRVRIDQVEVVNQNYKLLSCFRAHCILFTLITGNVLNENLPLEPVEKLLFCSILCQADFDKAVTFVQKFIL